MYVTQYIKSANNSTDSLFEAMNQGASQGQNGMLPQEAPSAPSGLVEFEDIKKYILFGKLKDIKLKMELACLDKQDPQVLNMFEFIDLVILFYNTFTYDQIQTLINNILEVTSEVLKISIAPVNPEAQPAVDSEKMAQVQQAQQDGLMAQQQQAAQHLTALSSAEAQITHNRVMSDPKVIRQSMVKGTDKAASKPHTNKSLGGRKR